MQHWVKKGNIFNPPEFGLEYAAVPILKTQSDNLNRRAIYFTDRINGKSHIFRGILDLEQNEIKKKSVSLVLKPGKSGFFDEDGVMTSSLIAYNDQLLLYYIGWSKTGTVPFRNALGLAISKDGGETFKKISTGPVLDRSIYDPCFVASADGIIENGKIRLWYLSALDWRREDHSYKPRYHIKYAESEDGVNWDRKGVVCIDFKNKFEYAISTPRVLKKNNKYLMWYSYRGGKDFDNYRIGFAESPDGISWKRMDDQVDLTVSANSWDSQMLAYPFLFTYKKSIYMLYNGNDYGKTGIGMAKCKNFYDTI